MQGEPRLLARNGSCWGWSAPCGQADEHRGCGRADQVPICNPEMLWPPRASRAGQR